MTTAVNGASGAYSASSGSNEDLIADIQNRLSELYNELQALRNIPQPVSATTLENQYSELLGQIQGTLNGDIEGEGLLSLMQDAEYSKDPDVKIFIQNSKGAFTAVLGDLFNGNIGDGTIASTVGDTHDFAKFLAGVIDQNGQNFLSKLTKDDETLDPQ